MPKKKSSSNASVYVGSPIKQTLKNFRRALMEGIRCDITCCNYQTLNSFGNITFVFKVKDKNDEDKKLVGISACE